MAETASFLTSWRTALRIARREARRAKGRSALVAVMIGIPVAALAFAAVTVDMLRLTGAEEATQRMGAADARVTWDLHAPVYQLPDPQELHTSIGVPGPDEGGVDLTAPGTTAELAQVLPGSTLLPMRWDVVIAHTPDGLGYADAVWLDATSPLTRGYVEVLAGRAPTAPGEVALTEQAMAWLGTGLGGTVTIQGSEDHPVYTVVGQVEFPVALDSFLLFAPEQTGAGVGGNGTSWLVDSPEPITWQRVLELNRLGIVVTSRWVLENPPPDEEVPLAQLLERAGIGDPEDVALGVLVGGLALLEVVLLAGPAFAVSARRRQRQLALVAANGGTPAHVRRIVLADGIVLGALGASVGIVLGVAAAFVARPWIEESIAHARGGGYRVFPEALAAIAGFAVVTGVAAALVPAFVTARQNVVASLAGRRGATRSRRRWIALGLVGICAGVAVTIYGTRQVDTTVVLAGLVIGELGIVLCTPALVGLVSRAGRFLPLAPRIALRDAARNRAAAAPAISAVMAAVAGSVALGMFLDSEVQWQAVRGYQPLPVDTILVDLGRGAPEAVAQAVRSVLPDARLDRLGGTRCADSTGHCSLEVLLNDACPQLAAQQRGEQLSLEQRRAAGRNPACDRRNLGATHGVQVADATAVAALTGASGEDLRRAEETLAAGGVVVRSPVYITDGRVRLRVRTPDPDAPAPDPDAPAPDPDAPVSEPLDWPFVNPGPPNADEPDMRSTVVELPGHLLTTAIGPGPAIIAPGALAGLGLASQDANVVVAMDRAPSSAEIERLQAALMPFGAYTFRTPTDDGVGTVLLLLLATAVVITIGAASVGTALAAADGRADLSTLAAVGASPRLRRGLSISQSAVIAGLGSLLGAVAGLGAALAVLGALAVNYGEVLWPDLGPPRPVVPWLTLLVTLVATPAVAVLGAGLFTRSRLPIERRH